MADGAARNGGAAQYITVKELLERIDATCSGMGESNPHRVLFQQCAVAIRFLANQVPDDRLQCQEVGPG